MDDPQVFDIVPAGLTDEEVDEAFDLYESKGSIRAVAKAMEKPYPTVRKALMRDPIRLEAVRAVRAEATAKRWEDCEAKAARVTLKMLNMYDEMVTHVQACADNGVPETDLLDPFDRTRPKMTPVQAMQYLLQVRILDQAQKVGMTGAKIAEGMRMVALRPSSPGAKQAGQGDLTEDEIRRTIEEIRAAGLPLPPGLAHWEKAQQIRPLPPADG